MCSLTKKTKQKKENVQQMCDLELVQKINSTNFRNETQRKLHSSVMKNFITFAYGSAGSGKSYVAIWSSLELVLKGDSKFNKIYLVKPYVTADEDIGFLPGGVEEKLDPFLMSFYINLEKIIGQQQVIKLKRNKTIEVLPIAYMRGVTFSNCIVILDEAQNATKEQIKMFLTRLGDDCKFIVAGDLKQSDLEKESGLGDAINRFNGINGVGIVKFSKDDIVRHHLVKIILERYGDED